jgi:hypothetical protein
LPFLVVLVYLVWQVVRKIILTKNFQQYKPFLAGHKMGLQQPSTRDLVIEGYTDNGTLVSSVSRKITIF